MTMNSHVVSERQRKLFAISKDLSGLLAEHSKKIREQTEEFQTKYKIIALSACATLAAVVWPFLAPFGIKVCAAAIAGGYGKTKIEELSKKKQSARSLLGVLADAKGADGEQP